MIWISLSTVILPIILANIQLVKADSNTTIDDNNPAISYINGAGGADICQVDSDGNIVAGQAGCFNTEPHNCTDHIGWSRGEGSGASLKFNGEHSALSRRRCLLHGPPRCSSSQEHVLISRLFVLGTGIVISAILNDGSNLFNVTLDGVSTSVDGARPSQPFVCATLFSQSGLDPTKEHEISVIVGGPSPTANATLDDSSQWSLLLDNFM